MTTLIKGGTIVNEGKEIQASVIVGNDRIVDIIEGGNTPRGIFDKVIDAAGSSVFPGVIDSHVHFREPGMTHKADIDSESRAAACGGVTSYFEMPNTVPQTVTEEALDNKFRLAAKCSHVNYSFFPGATNDNLRFLESLDVHRIPGIKLFMGSSTGNMLVDKRQQLESIFALAAGMGIPLMAHCEDTQTINANMAHYKQVLSTDDPEVKYHSLIRDAKACLESSSLGVSLARKYGTRFHIAHLSTAAELQLVGGNITAEACLPHLLFTDADYDKLGTRIKCNPAVKTASDREALLHALTSGIISTVSTDHAPHLLEEKYGGAAKAVSGMPMVQFSLPAMLTLSDEGWLSRTQVAQLMCHNQATLFGISKRGFIRKGYKADLTIVKRSPWQVTDDCVKSKCGWTPLCGSTLNWQVVTTICNGHVVYDKGAIDEGYRGEEIKFRTDDKEI
jgi:dihydroorotase